MAAALLLASCGSAADSQPATATPDGHATPGADAAAAAATGGSGTQTLSQPDNLQMVLLGYRLRGQTPPLADWAAGMANPVNEFQRSEAVSAEQQRLQGIYDGTADIGRLRFNVRAQLSAYDSSRGGYYLSAFQPGSSFSFTTDTVVMNGGVRQSRKETVHLLVENEEELNFWPLDAAAAQEVLRRSWLSSRNVTLDSQFLITGVRQRGDGPAITTRLLRYAIVGETSHEQTAVFGERTFDSPP